MSTTKKRSLWFFIMTLVVLAFFLIAVYAIGFKRQGEARWDLGCVGSMVKPYKEMDQKFVGISYDLMVAGLALTGFSILFATVLMILASVRKFGISERRRLFEGFAWTLIALVIICAILMLAGELNFMVKMFNYQKDHGGTDKTKFTSYWNGGYFAGMLIFTILPIGLIFIPWACKEMKMPRMKKHNKRK